MQAADMAQRIREDIVDGVSYINELEAVPLAPSYVCRWPAEMT